MIACLSGVGVHILGGIALTAAYYAFMFWAARQ